MVVEAKHNTGKVPRLLNKSSPTDDDDCDCDDSEDTEEDSGKITPGFVSVWALLAASAQKRNIKIR